MPDSLIPFKGLLSPRFHEVHKNVQEFVKQEIIPNLNVYEEQKAALTNRWSEPPIAERWKAKARSAGLWNLFLPEVSGMITLVSFSIAPCSSELWDDCVIGASHSSQKIPNTNL